MRFVFLATIIVIDFLILSIGLPIWEALPLMLLAGYALVPLLVRFGTRIPVAPPVHLFEPGTHDASLEQLAHLSTTTAQLRPLGFRPLGELFIDWPRQPSGAQEQTMVLVFDNDAGTRAVATASTIITAKGRRARNAVEFATRFPTHVRLTSNVERRLIVAPPRADRRSVQLPQLRNAALLAQAHEALVARDAAGTPTPIPIGDLVPIMTDHLRDDQQRMLAAGLLQLDRGGTNYVLTLGAAVGITPRLVWPMPRIIAARTRRRASAVLAELGLSRLEAGM